jgi:hypothetical protein
MTIRVLELNDIDIRIGDTTGIIASSPGYATVIKDRIYTGGDARKLAHLHPRQTYNRFWVDLSHLDPLAVPTPRFRHHADIAYEHMKNLHELAGKPTEIMLAVSGSFSNERLSLLLGIIQALPFNATGLVDSAVAATASVAGPGRYQHIEIMLHQTVVTTIDVDTEVVRKEVDTLDNGGMTAIHDAIALLLTEQFVNQCRFDPLHHAESEQELHNLIPDCLKALTTQPKTQVEIRYHNNRYQIILGVDMLLGRIESFYQGILQRLDISRTTLLSDHVTTLPAFADMINGAVCLSADAVLQGCLEHHAAIQTTGTRLGFITRLPLPTFPLVSSSNLSAETQYNPQQRMTGTHLLVGHRIYPLSHVPVYISVHGSVDRLRQSSSVCAISLNNINTVITPLGSTIVHVNGEPLTGTNILCAGDIIGFADAGPVCSLVTLVAPDVA